MLQVSISDKELLHGIMAHDDDALRHLYHSTYAKIESFVLKNSGNVEDAKDVFQEGVIALYQNIESGKYQPDASTKLTSYLFQICKFQWYSVLRSAHKKRTVDTVDNQLPGKYDLAFEKDIEEWDENKYVRHAINQLGESCKELLLAFYYEEKSMKEIADRLGQQPNSVKNAKYRCMQKLKEFIKTRPI